MSQAGIGYDLHRMAEGRKLILGGIELPFPKGPVGHSDGDALAHALCDALWARRVSAISARIFQIQTQGGKTLPACVSGTYPRSSAQHQFRIVHIDAIVITEKPNWVRTFRPCARLWRNRWASHRR